MMYDVYEFTMVNSYYNSGKSNETAVFNVFFRNVPNDGEYAIMAGLDKISNYDENMNVVKLPDSTWIIVIEKE